MPNYYLSPESIDELKKLLGDNWCLATNEQWQAAKTHYEKTKRQAISDLNAVRFSNVSDEEKEAQKIQIDQRIEACNHLLFLIVFCTTYQSENKTANFYSFLIEGLLKLGEDETADKKAINENINSRLSDYVAFSPQEALKYYTSFLQIKLDEIYIKNESGELVYPYLPVMVYFGGKVVEYHLGNLNKLLATQSSPSGIIALIEGYIENPPLFAASLIWLLNKGVGPYALINSGLLHTFIKAYIYDIANENSSIHLLFKWLEMQEKKIEIITFMRLTKTISCKSGDTDIMRGFEHYSLSGEKRNKEEKALKQVYCQLPKFSPTLNKENFINLHACFGIVFLEKTLDKLSIKISRNKHTKLIIHRLSTHFQEIPPIDRQEIILELIKQFSRVISEGKKEFLFEALSRVLSEDMIKGLLKQDVSTICMAPHIDSFNAIIEDKPFTLAKRIYESNHFITEKIEYLSILLNQYPHNKALFSNVFKYFLLTEENAVSSFSMISNNLAIETIFNRHRDDIGKIINEKLRIFKDKELSFIIKMVRGLPMEDIYNELEDCWQLLDQQMRFEKYGYNIKIDSFPTDKYILKASVIQAYCAQPRSEEAIAKALLAVIGNTHYEAAITLIYAEALLEAINTYKSEDIISYLAKNRLYCYIINDLTKNRKLCDNTATIFLDKAISEYPAITADLLKIPETFSILYNSLFKLIKNTVVDNERFKSFFQLLSADIVIKLINDLKQALDDVLKNMIDSYSSDSFEKENYIAISEEYFTLCKKIEFLNTYHSSVNIPDLLDKINLKLWIIEKFYQKEGENINLIKVIESAESGLLRDKAYYNISFTIVEMLVKTKNETILNLIVNKFKEHPALLADIFIILIERNNITHPNLERRIIWRSLFTLGEKRNQSKELFYETSALVEKLINQLSLVINSEISMKKSLTHAIVQISTLDAKPKPFSPALINLVPTYCLTGYMRVLAFDNTVAVIDKFELLSALLNNSINKEKQDSYKKYLLSILINLFSQDPTAQRSAIINKINLFEGIECYFLKLSSLQSSKKLFVLLYFLHAAIEKNDSHLLEAIINGLQEYFKPEDSKKITTSISEVLQSLVFLEEKKEPISHVLRNALQALFSNEKLLLISRGALLEFGNNIYYFTTDMHKKALANIISEETAIEVLKQNIDSLDFIQHQTGFSNYINADTLLAITNSIFNDDHCKKVRNLEILTNICKKKQNKSLGMQILKPCIDFAFQNQKNAEAIWSGHPFSFWNQFWLFTDPNQREQLFEEKFKNYHSKLIESINNTNFSSFQQAIIVEHIGPLGQLSFLEKIAKSLNCNINTKLSQYCSNEIFIITAYIEIWKKQVPKLQFYGVESRIDYICSIAKKTAQEKRSIYLELLLLFVNDDFFNNIKDILGDLTESEVDQLSSRSLEGENQSLILYLDEKRKSLSIAMPKPDLDTKLDNFSQPYPILESLPKNEPPVLVRKKNCFDKIFTYFCPRRQRSSLSEQDFFTRLDDFCRLLSIIEAFINQEPSWNRRPTMLMEQLSSYMDSAQGQKAKSISISLLFVTNRSLYIRLREDLLNFDADSLLVQYQEFKKTILQLANNDSCSSLVRPIVEKLSQQFTASQPNRVLNNNNNYSDDEPNITYRL